MSTFFSVRYAPAPPPSKFDGRMTELKWHKCTGSIEEMGPVFFKGLTNAYPEHRMIKAAGRRERTFDTVEAFEAELIAIAARFDAPTGS